MCVQCTYRVFVCYLVNFLPFLVLHKDSRTCKRVVACFLPWYMHLFHKHTHTFWANISRSMDSKYCIRNKRKCVWVCKHINIIGAQNWEYRITANNKKYEWRKKWTNKSNVYRWKSNANTCFSNSNRTDLVEIVLSGVFFLIVFELRAGN